MPRKTERKAPILPTTTLMLFRYPHKFGGGSSWCVGFEMSHTRPEGTFVSQRFISPWSEHHAAELVRFNSWA